MKRLAIATFALGLALTLTAQKAEAQSLTFGLGGGITIPTGTFSDAAKTGWHGLANIGYGLPSGIGIRGDFFYGQDNFKGGGGKFKLAGGLGNITYSFGGATGVTPYVIGSLGMFNLKTDVAGAGSSTKVTYGGGLGLKLKAGPTAHLFAEGRYLSISTSGSHANFIPLTVGVNFGI